MRVTPNFGKESLVLNFGNTIQCMWISRCLFRMDDAKYASQQMLSSYESVVQLRAENRTAGQTYDAIELCCYFRTFHMFFLVQLYVRL